MNRTTTKYLLVTALVVIGVLIAAVGAYIALAGAGTVGSHAPIVVGATSRTSAKTGAKPGASAQGASGKPVTLAGLVAVSPAKGTTVAQVAKAAGVPAGSVRRVDAQTVEVQVPKGSSAAEIVARVNRTDVATAEAMHLRFLAYTPPMYTAPNDPVWSSGTVYDPGTPWATESWWLGPNGMNAVSGWKQGLTGGAIGTTGLRAAGSAKRIAVIDSGFYLTHPDRSANIVGKRDFMDSWDGTSLSTIKTDSDVTPAPDMYRTGETSHGTAVAGEIAAATNNLRGTTGASWDSQVYVYKVMGYATKPIDLNGDGYADVPAGGLIMIDQQIAKAIRQAADDGCKVINLSLGGTGSSDILQSAIDYAHGKGAIVVAAIGNDGTYVTNPTYAFYPGAGRYVVGVGAADYDPSTGGRTRAVWDSSGGSNYGYGLDLYAPGSYVFGLEGASNYDWWTGTSMASPAAAAGIAFLWRAVPNLPADSLLSTIRSTWIPVTNSASDGVGSLDIGAAYSKLVADYPLLAAPNVTVPAVSTSKTVPVLWTASNGYGVTYAVAFDGVSASTGLAATGSTYPGLSEGTHTVSVQATSARNWYDASSRRTATFVVDSTVPTITPFAYGNGTLLWATNEGPTLRHTMMQIDGAEPVTVSGSEYGVSDLTAGVSHDATLTVTDAAGRVATKALTFTPSASQASRAVLSASPKGTIVYGTTVKFAASAASATVSVPLDGVVLLESSTDGGATWKTAASANVAGASYTFSLKPSARALWRVRVPGAAPSSAVSILVKARLSTPSVSASPRINRTATISGRIEPKHAAGSAPVVVTVQRKVGTKWVTVQRTTPKSANGTSWAVGFKPRYRGSYRAVASHADAQHAFAASAYKTFTVR